MDINPFLVWLGNLKIDKASMTVRGPAVKSAAVLELATGPASRALTSWKPELHQIEKWWDVPTLHVPRPCAMPSATRPPTQPAIWPTAFRTSCE